MKIIYFRHCDNNAIINSTELDDKGYGTRLRSTYNEKKLQLALQETYSTMSNLQYL